MVLIFVVVKFVGKLVVALPAPIRRILKLPMLKTPPNEPLFAVKLPISKTLVSPIKKLPNVALAVPNKRLPASVRVPAPLILSIE